MAKRKPVALYVTYLVKGKQNFHIGDNIKDFMEWPRQFKEDRKLLDWSTDFFNIVKDIAFVAKLKEGFSDFMGYNPPKTEKELINHCLVITTSTGKIRGILSINKNNNEEV